MPWFRVDDKLHSHVKAARAGVDAMGLWLLCGSWCMDHLTDGFVPDYIALRIDSKARAKARRLVAAGLWIEGTKDADRGWYYHDWLETQPSRDQLEAQRSAAADRQRRAREAAQERRQIQADKAKAENVTDMSRRDSHRDKGVSHAPPIPSHPIPSQREEQTPTESGPRKRGTRLPEGWEPSADLVAQMHTECPSVDLRREHAVFADYWTAQPGQKGVKLDWPATWRNWMRRAATPRNGTRPEPTPPRSYPNARDLPAHKPAADMDPWLSAELARQGQA